MLERTPYNLPVRFSRNGFMLDENLRLLHQINENNHRISLIVIICERPLPDRITK